LGVSALAGVGFTMSIFIGELAYTDVNIINEAKLGVLIGSLVSGIAGYLILNRVLPKSA
jgi:NhaA family Na+:H+ antiporter